MYRVFSRSLLVLVVGWATLSISIAQAEKGFPEAQTGFTIVDSGSAFIITSTQDIPYSMRIENPGFRFGFQFSGHTVDPHLQSGLLFSGSTAAGVTLTGHNEETVIFEVTADNGQKATVKVYPGPHGIRLSVEPESSAGGRIESRLSGINEAWYGLGDFGGGNMAGFSASIPHDGAAARFITPFTICPSRRFAQVQMIQGDERFGPHCTDIVAVTSSATRIGADNVSSLKYIYYFLGEMGSIYSAFRAAKIEAGYPDMKPYFTLIEGSGWEAWPSLKWNTNQKSVMEANQEFLDHGYKMKWAVAGSGWWSAAGDADATTSFGKFNTSKYPDPKGMVDWFHQNDMKLIFGLRSNFPLAHPEGVEAEAQGYVAHDGTGQPLVFKSRWKPLDDFYLLDAFDSSWHEWWMENTALWGVDGWKEDVMVDRGEQVYHPGFANKPMEVLHRRGDLVIARCAYVSAPGTTQRINDTKGEEERIPRLVIAYGESGAPTVYADGIGNASDNPVYLTRHTILEAVTASMGFGKKPWDAGEANSNAMKMASDWHYMYGAYIYSAALKSYLTGYPYTLTPLNIAYPDDAATYNLTNQKKWEWMLGESMLAHPAFANGGWTRDVYLPEGKWMDYTNKTIHQGPKTLTSLDHPMANMPVFIGGKGVTIRRDMEDENKLTAEVWPIANGGSQFTYHHFDGVKKSVITNSNPSWDSAQIDIWDKTDMIKTSFHMEAGGVIVFSLIPGHDFELVQAGTLTAKQGRSGSDHNK